MPPKAHNQIPRPCAKPPPPSPPRAPRAPLFLALSVPHPALRCGCSKWEVLYRTKEQQHQFNFPYQLGPQSEDKPQHGHMHGLKVEPGDALLVAPFQATAPARCVDCVLQHCPRPQAWGRGRGRGMGMGMGMAPEPSHPADR